VGAVEWPEAELGSRGRSTTTLAPLRPGMHVLTKPFAMEALANRIKDLIVGINLSQPIKEVTKYFT
jgi:DNA-binding response OmpR family regulator